MKDKGTDNIKLEIIRHTCFCGIASIPVFLASFIETNVSLKIFMLIKNIL